MSDYREMWKNLDMDVKKHDELCDILPKFYSDIYLSQENRPEGMNYFNFVMSEVHGLRIKELVQSKEDNKKVVGTFCVYVPDEVINAVGGISVGLCSGSDFWIPDGEKHLPRNTCPLVKSAVGAKVSGTCPYFQSCDMIVGETTCDGKKKAWEILDDYTNMYVMDLPQMKRKKDYKHWEEEIKEFSNELSKLTDQKLTVENLEESIDLINKKREVLQKLYDFRKMKNLPISGKDALLITQIAFYDNIERFIEKTEELIEELEKRVEKGISVFKEDTPRILVTGTPMAVPNWKLHHLIETSGGAVVCEETCTGTRYFENLVDNSGVTIDEKIKALSDRYMKINCACFTPNLGRTDDILRLHDEYNADGVIYFSLPFCNTYAIEAKQVIKKLEEKDIPVIHVETDYSMEDVGQLKTRLQAFFEMIK
ncbi:MAG: double-cubane-cluster-containing anaerobic reductase [Bacillota bacterium]